MENVRNAVNDTFRKFEGHLVGRKEILIGVLLAAFVGAIFFTIRDFGHVNVVLSFLFGIITSILYFLVSFGGLLSWGFFSLLAFNISRRLYDRPVSYTKRSHDEIGVRFYVYGFVLTFLWIGPLLWIASMVPILGDQVGFMFRDR